jgi:dipeptidyl-peptidase-3
MGNYRGFGDTKFIPDLPKHKLESLVLNSKAFQNSETQIKFLWDNVKEKLYSLTDNELALGFSPKVIKTFCFNFLFNEFVLIWNLL